jgi:hypothetical protein
VFLVLSTVKFEVVKAVLAEAVVRRARCVLEDAKICRLESHLFSKAYQIIKKETDVNGRPTADHDA